MGRSSVIHFFGLVAVFGLAACGRPQVDPETAALIDDFVGYDELKIELDPKAEVSGTLELLAKRINEDAPVSFSQISDLMAREHHAVYDPEASDEDYQALAKKIRRLTDELPTENPHKMKRSLERRIEKANKSKIMYDPQADTLAATFDGSTLQCYSGSSSLSLAARVAMSPKVFRSKNFVMIFEPGHILFGYMKAEGKKSWRLIGIESTVEGSGKVDYGLVKDLPAFVSSQGASYGLRIMDAEYFAILEVFQEALADPEATTQQMLELTAKKYGIDLKPLEDSVAASRKASQAKASQLKSPSASADRLLRHSAAGFGSSQVAEEPKARHRVESSKASTNRAKNALSSQELQRIDSPAAKKLDFAPESVK